MRTKVYLVLGLLGLINTSTGNPVGFVFKPLFGVIGSTIGDIFSGVAVIFLLLAWYFRRKDKYQDVGTLSKESGSSKYGFWTIVLVFGGLFLYIAIYGFLNFLSGAQ